jgi:uncharacterized protein YqfB (UPF0267 family)
MILILANIGLFIIGLVIIYMFLEHSLLYQLGLPLLALIGAIMVFLTIRLIMFFTTLKIDPEKSQDVIVFSEQEKELILTGNKTQKIFTGPKTSFRRGKLVDAKTKVTDKKPFAQLRIRRTYNKPFEDLTKEEILKEGFDTMKALKKVFSSESKVNNEISVVVFRLED